MDLSKGLITKLVDEGKLNEVQRQGIDVSFLDEEYGAVFNYLYRHQRQYGDRPSRGALLQAFPNFQFADHDEPLAYYIDTLRESKRRGVLDKTLHESAKLYQKNTTRAEEILRQGLKDLQITQKAFKDSNFAGGAAERYERYKERKLNPGITGIRSDWPRMDYQTLGWQPEEFVVLVGEKYIGKSWIMVYLAYQAMLHGERVLFITKEMSTEAIERRLDAVYAGVPFESLRRGELTEEEEGRYRDKILELSKSDLNYVIARQGVSTIEDIEQKCIEHDATIVFGDSVYLFDPDANWRGDAEPARRAKVSQKCKSVAQQLGIPFIVSVQARRKQTKDRTPDLDNIEWSNSFSQDADTVFELYRDEVDRDLDRMQVWILKSRDGNIDNFFIDNDFEYMKFGEREDETAPTTDIELEETLDYEQT